MHLNIQVAVGNELLMPLDLLLSFECDGMLVVVSSNCEAAGVNWCRVEEYIVYVA